MLALAASPAFAQIARPRDEEACLNVLKDAKAKEQEGQLQGARALLRQCAQTPCSAFVRQQCANKNTKLEMDTPSVVLLVTDAAGSSRTDVQVKVDGEPFASTLDGRAVPIDPGMHDFSFIADGHVFANFGSGFEQVVSACGALTGNGVANGISTGLVQPGVIQPSAIQPAIAPSALPFTPAIPNPQMFGAPPLQTQQQVIVGNRACWSTDGRGQVFVGRQ